MTWPQTQTLPVAYHENDWDITVTLQLIESDLIVKAAGAALGSAGIETLPIVTVLMLTC